jgi:very-short-patch-repair endonuclease
MVKKSDLERHLETHIKQVGLPEPRTEFKFAYPFRRWRADFAWPDRRILVEIEGGTWIRGAHVRGSHFESDCEKYNWAMLNDWIVLRFTTDMVHDGRAIATIEEAFKRTEGGNDAG